MSNGTSPPIELTGESLSARKNPLFSPVQGVPTDVYGKQVEVKPPKIDPDNVSEALRMNKNAFPQFTFEKIGEPEYGVTQKGVTPIGHYTGVPVNRPDYINDYFVISIMRAVDKIVNPSYKGKVVSLYNTPNPKS